MIIPTRNRPELTLEGIESVRAQSFGDWHLFVVDDASTDDTVARVCEAVSGDNRVTVLRRDRQGGANPARQYAFERTGAPLVAICDSDDLWEPAKLRRQVDEWDAAAYDPGLVLCWHDAVDAAGNRMGEVLGPRRSRRWHPFTIYNTSTPLISRRLLDDVGGFASGSPYPWRTTDHLDLFLRLTRRHSGITVPEVLVHCRHHSGPRNSDGEHTASAAEESLAVLRASAKEVADRPRLRAWMEAWVASRYVELGEFRSARPHAAAALRVGGPRTAARMIAHYGPWTAREVYRHRAGAR